VLIVASENRARERIGENRLYGNLCDAHRCLEEECLVWRQVVEQNLLYGCLSSPSGYLVE